MLRGSRLSPYSRIWPLHSPARNSGKRPSISMDNFAAYIARASDIRARPEMAGLFVWKIHSPKPTLNRYVLARSPAKSTLLD
jgi:hypothetical protein